MSEFLCIFAQSTLKVDYGYTMPWVVLYSMMKLVLALLCFSDLRPGSQTVVIANFIPSFPDTFRLAPSSLE